MAAPSEQLTVTLEGGVVTANLYPAREPLLHAALVLAHGAGGNQHAPFIVDYAQGLSARGVPVATFNFPYSEQRRRLPDPRPRLEACFAAVIETVRALFAGHELFAGGKSMGGRIATHLAAANPAAPLAGLVLLGYPLHPPGRPDQRRDSHLPDVKCPMLFVQGSRDPFGTPAELEPILQRLTPTPQLHVIEGGDHGFSVRGATSAGKAAGHAAIQDVVVSWIREVIA